MRVAIVGGGVMGCAVALELHRRGLRDVVILEAGAPGAEASSAAAGMLAAQAEAATTEQCQSFARARDAYPAWADELRAHTGIDIGYRKSGALVCSDEVHGPEALSEMVALSHTAGLRAERLGAHEALSVEPELAKEAVQSSGAVFFPDEAQVDPPRLMRALLARVHQANLTLRPGVTVARLLRDTRSSSQACRGVVLGDGDTLEADAVVLAAGSWSSLVDGVSGAISPVWPVRGQLVEVEELPPRLATLVFAGKNYIVPRGDGRVVCGSTVERVGHHRAVTASGVGSILSRSVRMVPRLGDAGFLRAWCNFRPQSESGPLVGETQRQQLFVATGHYRNGILLAKATAETVAASICESERLASF